MTYSQKLRDPRWQKKRLQILERDRWKCVACEDDQKNLQVHHVVYRKIDPWDYPDECLQTLCCDCHELRQRQMDALVDQFRMHLKDIPNDDILGAHHFFITIAEAYERSRVTQCRLPRGLFEDAVMGLAYCQITGVSEFTKSAIRQAHEIAAKAEVVK